MGAYVCCGALLALALGCPLAAAGGGAKGPVGPVGVVGSTPEAAFTDRCERALASYVPPVGRVVSSEPVARLLVAGPPAPVVLAEEQTACRVGEDDGACVARAEAASRERAPGRPLESALVPGEGARLVVVRVLDGSTDSAACRLDEDDEACRERLRVAAAERRPDDRVTVSLAGEPVIRAALQVDGRPETFVAKTWEALAEHLDALRAQGRTVALQVGERELVRETRRATVTAVRTTAPPPRLRLERWFVWDHGRDAVAPAALLDHLEQAGLAIVEFQSTEDGAARVRIACEP